jgi:hypothetical protein
MLLGNKLVMDKPVPLGGGLVATLSSMPGYHWVTVVLRAKGAGDLNVITGLGHRESAQIAAEDTETALVRLASALRQAGAA